MEKNLKKLVTMQQGLLNETEAYKELVNILDDKTYTEPLRKIIADREAQIARLEKRTGEKLTPKDSDVKYVRRMNKFFGTRRLFSNLASIMKEKRKETRDLSGDFPELRTIAAAEGRYQETFTRLAGLVKKKNKL